MGAIRILTRFGDIVGVRQRIAAVFIQLTQGIRQRDNQRGTRTVIVPGTTLNRKGHRCLEAVSHIIRTVISTDLIHTVVNVKDVHIGVAAGFALDRPVSVTADNYELLRAAARAECDYLRQLAQLHQGANSDIGLAGIQLILLICIFAFATLHRLPVFIYKVIKYSIPIHEIKRVVERVGLAHPWTLANLHWVIFIPLTRLRVVIGICSRKAGFESRRGDGIYPSPRSLIPCLECQNLGLLGDILNCTPGTASDMICCLGLESVRYTVPVRVGEVVDLYGIRGRVCLDCNRLHLPQNVVGFVNLHKPGRGHGYVRPNESSITSRSGICSIRPVSSFCIQNRSIALDRALRRPIVVLHGIRRRIRDVVNLDRCIRCHCCWERANILITNHNLVEPIGRSLELVSGVDFTRLYRHLGLQELNRLGDSLRFSFLHIILIVLHRVGQFLGRFRVFRPLRIQRMILSVFYSAFRRYLASARCRREPPIKRIPRFLRHRQIAIRPTKDHRFAGLAVAALRTLVNIRYLDGICCRLHLYRMIPPDISKCIATARCNGCGLYFTIYPNLGYAVIFGRSPGNNYTSTGLNIAAAPSNIPTVVNACRHRVPCGIFGEKTCVSINTIGCRIYLCASAGVCKIPPIEGVSYPI